MASERCAGPNASASGLDGVEHSWCVGCRPAGPQLLPPYGCSTRALWSFWVHASLDVLLRPAVFSQLYRHLRWGLDWRSRHTYFSSVDGPGTRPCGAVHSLQGSFQPHRPDSITLSRCYFTVAPYVGGWAWSGPGHRSGTFVCSPVYSGLDRPTESWRYPCREFLARWTVPKRVYRIVA
jgi:hypothetical protein